MLSQERTNTMDLLVFKFPQTDLFIAQFNLQTVENITWFYSTTNNLIFYLLIG